MLVGSKYKLSQLQNMDHLNIHSNGSFVKQVNVADYFCIKIQDNLIWDYQISKVCKQLSQKIGILSRLRQSTPKDMLMKIYVSSIQPTIDYALTVWGSTTLNNQ